MTAVIQDIDVGRCVPSPSARPIMVAHVAVLAESIKQVGLRQPINVRSVDGRFEVRGGRHRLEAFKSLGRSTIPAIVSDESEISAELAEIDENLIRNDLSPIARDIAIARRKVLYEMLHPETAHGGDRKSSRHDGDLKSGKAPKIEAPAPKPPRFTKATADATGQGERTVQRSVSRVEAIGADVLSTIVDTKLNEGSELDALAKLSPAARDDVVKRAIAGEAVSAKVVFGKERRETRERDLADQQRALPEKRYGLIYVDIPRHFNVRSDETGFGRSPENHYPTMSFEDHLALPVPALAASDCILVFWSTAASLIDDLDIMAEWGFVSLRPRGPDGRILRDPEAAMLHDAGGGKYKSMQVWDKVHMGLGYWFRDRHEFILIGTRGNVVPPAPGTQDQSLFTEAKGAHSAKPKSVAEMIERLWPNTPKIEMFCRGPARPGWDAWGNEAQDHAGDVTAMIPVSIIIEPEAQPDPTDTPSSIEPSGDDPQSSAMASCSHDVGAAHGSSSDLPPHEHERTQLVDPVTDDDSELPPKQIRADIDVSIPDWLDRRNPECRFRREGE